MRFLPLIFLLILISCNKDNFNGSVDCAESDCEVLNDYAIGAIRTNNGVELNIGIYKFIDGPFKVCGPDAADIYMSEDNVTFEKIDRLSSFEESTILSNLENDKAYYFQVVSLHCELDSIITGPIMIKPGPNNYPTPTDNLIGVSMDKFDISDDRSKVIYRTTSESWWVAGYNAMIGKHKFAEKSFQATWLSDNTHVAYIPIVKIDNKYYSQGVSLYNVDTRIDKELYAIDNLGEHSITGLRGSMDGESVFFYTRKDNGEPEGKHYDNIWSLNITNGDLTRLTDFYPIDFDMVAYTEDPNNPNSFYLMGGNYEPYSNNRTYDIYYWNTQEQALTPILIDDFNDNIESISPDGEKLLLESSRSGRSELWVYDLITEEITQATDRHLYGPNKFKSNAKWIDNNTFLLFMELDGIKRFVEFNVD